MERTYSMHVRRVRPTGTAPFRCPIDMRGLKIDGDYSVDRNTDC